MQANRGFSLVEAMISLLILSVGMLGLANMSILAGHSTGVGRKYSQAVAIAHDLLQQIEMWDYSDPRLENRNTANDDADLQPPKLLPLLDNLQPPTLTSAQQADFVESTVDTGIAAATTTLEADFSGIPKAALPPGFQRMWSVKEIDLDADGIINFKVVALTVRWQDDVNKDLWRQATFFTAKMNPAELAL